MAFLLDSNLVIPYLADDPATVHLVERLVPEGISISIITDRVETMATVPKTIRVTAETDLPELLDDAARAPIILERDGERFRLSRDEDVAYEPDPEYVRATLEATLGSWADLDIDEIIREFYEAREAGSRPRHRP